MKDRKQQRLELLRRLREMSLEQARADHVAAQSELDEKRARVEDTQGRLHALDYWQLQHLGGDAPLLPEVLLQAQLFRAREKDTLEQQHADEAKSEQRTEAARGELTQHFERLSVVERLAARQAATALTEQLRVAYVELDEAGTQRMNLEAKE